MTRGKLKFEYISNDSERKASFRKRKKGLLNKAHELCALCGVEACAIIFCPMNLSQFGPNHWMLGKLFPDFGNCQKWNRLEECSTKNPILIKGFRSLKNKPRSCRGRTK
ncbi:MADS-box domain-containing protein [Abeliophyllum distichum]|uniref:MADS-box domain-containing protein n=1 Tax=Abeliophyllum distichum TaxID=126358 RepID=A0ABD1Q5B6_9LAMI